MLTAMLVTVLRAVLRAALRTALRAELRTALRAMLRAMLMAEQFLLLCSGPYNGPCKQLRGNTNATESSGFEFGL